MKILWVLLAAAFSFWFLIFSPWTQSHVPFWIGMSIATFFLGMCSIIAGRSDKQLFEFRSKYIFIGLGSAVVLYLFFLSGGFAVKLFGFAERGVNDIYTIRQKAPLVMIGFLIFFIIGPCEEFFWRGFIQNRFSKRYGDFEGYLLAAFFYAIGHIWSFNFMLILTAGICGLFWGYIFNRYKSIWPVVISHAVWDLTIFVLLPVTTFTQ
ncbi:MAG: CPBP family intramembrane metalloprotease [Sedimentisphaerales bacterium]|nr:CPBP family intramembrane metalloprotease [Sedimentisphaerales bacterium]